MGQYQLWLASVIAVAVWRNKVATTAEKEIAKSLWWVAQGYGRAEDWKVLV